MVILRYLVKVALLSWLSRGFLDRSAAVSVPEIRTHAVVRGESLATIRRKFYLGANDIAVMIRENHLGYDGNRIFPGQSLRLPFRPVHQWQEHPLGEGLTINCHVLLVAALPLRFLLRLLAGGRRRGHATRCSEGARASSQRATEQEVPGDEHQRPKFDYQAEEQKPPPPPPPPPRRETKTEISLRTLNLAMPLTHDNLRRAYHQAARRHHPDLGGALRKMQEINAAFDHLTSIAA